IPCTSVSSDTVTPAVTSVRIIRWYDGVLIDWRLRTDADRVAALLKNVQRLGQIGGWEHSLVTGETTWTGQTFALFGLPLSAEPVSPRDLRAYVHPKDAQILAAFSGTLWQAREASATFRLIRPDGAIRQIRAHG